MNTGSPTNDGREHRDPAHDALTQAARRTHATSLDGISARTQAQLAQRRRAATAPVRPARAMRWWPAFALGSAAALALVVGLKVQQSPVFVEAVPTALNTDAIDEPVDVVETILVSEAADAFESDDAFETFEENPDLYLWLVSEDAADLAVESL